MDHSDLGERSLEVERRYFGTVRERRPLDAGNSTSDGSWNSSEIRDMRRSASPPSQAVQATLVPPGPEMSAAVFSGSKALTGRSPPKPNRAPAFLSSLVKPVFLAGESSGSTLTLTPLLPKPPLTSTTLINAPSLSNTFCCAPGRDSCPTGAVDKNSNRRSLEIGDKGKSINFGWTFQPSGLVHSSSRRTFEFLKLGLNSDGLTWTLLLQVPGSDPFGLVLDYQSPFAGGVLDLPSLLVPGPDPLALQALDYLLSSMGGAPLLPLGLSESGTDHPGLLESGPDSTGTSRTLVPRDPLGLYHQTPSTVGTPGYCDFIPDGLVLRRKTWTSDSQLDDQVPTPTLVVDRSPAPAPVDQVAAPTPPTPGDHGPAPVPDNHAPTSAPNDQAPASLPDDQDTTLLQVSTGSIGSHLSTPPRASARLSNQDKANALGRAMNRKATLLEGATSGSVKPTCKVSRKKIKEKGLKCGVMLSDVEAKDLQRFMSFGV
uniref:Uncharacterized protein n=1 Tax=Ananas comosus var. bracteatus TaxID=296719 RepID=A0A6V7PA81_ANACO|nr:unnamed protein product [Ananas comosus var. bracteatus]